MGFFDRDVRDGFDAMFDFNHDGKQDYFEEMTQFDFIDEATKEDSDDDSDEEEFSGFEDELEEELEEYGLDYDELEAMDEDELREALEDAGLDPDDYLDDF